MGFSGLCFDLEPDQFGVALFVLRCDVTDINQVAGLNLPDGDDPLSGVPKRGRGRDQDGHGLIFVIKYRDLGADTVFGRVGHIDRRDICGQGHCLGFGLRPDVKTGRQEQKEGKEYFFHRSLRF